MKTRMTERLSPFQATERLNSILAQNGVSSKYLVAYQTTAGRHLALSRQAKETQVWLEICPTGIDGVVVKKNYGAEDPRTSNLNSGRGSRLAVGQPAVLVTVESIGALDQLVAWYAHAPLTPAADNPSMCLIGTWKGFNNMDFNHVTQFIAKHGGWASWWSFRVKKEARSLLKLPCWLYVNRGGDSITARYLIGEMVTGSDPVISPWPEQTEAHLVGKTSDGEKASGVCKTWFRVSKIELLPVAMKTTDFEPVDGLSIISSLLNQKTFGYAYLKNQNHLEGENNMPVSKTPPVSLNTILYGPPGTSKTFETIEYALRIIDPQYLTMNSQDRVKLKDRFDVLRTEGRIEFVTFHQSYSYEDFVEGIRASTEDGKIVYQVEDGIFKRLCGRAMAKGGDEKFSDALDKFKKEVEEEPVELKTKTGKSFSVTWRGGKTLRLRPHSSASDVDYPVSLDNIERSYRGEDDDGFYNLSYVRAVLSHVTTKWDVKNYVEGSASRPYVLVIDEINRGNIASIFGELITLIEPSKRSGSPEVLSIVLPYSKKSASPFSVPDNLYIVGTMNTADRSLARVDTALRRRFDFVPMYPRPSDLEGVVVEGIDISKLLSRINDRIELLYDRDHLIGHAFFMGLKADPGKRNLSELAHIFRNKIIPLLEEYFFEDWQKIRLVLADNQKKDREFQFVVEDNPSSSAGLFGDDQSDIRAVRYERNDDALMRAKSYIDVYEIG